MMAGKPGAPRLMPRFWEMGIVEIESEWTARDREQKAGRGLPRISLRPG